MGRKSARLDGHALDSLGQADGGAVADALHRPGEEGREPAGADAGPVRGGGGGGSHDPEAGPGRRGQRRQRQRQRRKGGGGEEQRHLVGFSGSRAGRASRLEAGCALRSPLWWGVCYRARGRWRPRGIVWCHSATATRLGRQAHVIFQHEERGEMNGKEN